MKFATVLFDTSVYPGYKHKFKGKLPGYLSAVVLQELTAAANGKADLQYQRRTMEYYRTQGRLLVPDEAAWYTAGQILNHILSDQSRNRPDRHRPKFSNDKKQSIICDVLIVVSAKQHNVIVISDNEDFPLIAEYYKFRWKAGREFFA